MLHPKLHFHFITLFPEAIRVWLTTSIMGRAHDAGLFRFDLYQLRDFATNKHKSVDDAPYGGGGGMVLKLDPLVEALESIVKKSGIAKVIYLSPAGRLIDQSLLEELRPQGKTEHLILVCGHYEGVDQRFIDHWVNLEVSLGNFILTGGEIPAVALADALIRSLEGALGDERGALQESFTLRDPKNQRPLLEYPHYTRPADFRGIKVPEVLLSGNHHEIECWRLEQARIRTNKEISGGGTGKTTSEMKTQATFSGWDFTQIWKMSPNDYPRLKWEP